MWNFIAQYWLQFGFGIIVALLGIGWKKLSSMIKKEKLEKQEIFYNKMREDLRADYKHTMKIDEEQRNQIKELETEIDQLYQAVLDFEGKDFKTECHKFLEPHYYISLQEYESLGKKFDEYKAKGGNGEGTRLFNLITEKFKAQNDK